MIRQKNTLIPFKNTNNFAQVSTNLIPPKQP